MLEREKTIYSGTILALDTASRATGYAIYQGGVIIKSGVWKLKPQRNLVELYKYITEAISRNNVSQVIAEDIYKNPDKRNAYERLSECRGIVTLCNQTAQLPEIAFIESSRVCNELWGYNPYKTYYRQMSRAEKKEHTIKYLINRGYLSDSETSDDRADAIALLLAWLQIHRYQAPTTGY